MDDHKAAVLLEDNKRNRLAYRRLVIRIRIIFLDNLSNQCLIGKFYLRIYLKNLKKDLKKTTPYEVVLLIT